MGKQEMTLIERLVAPTSKFFKAIRNVGLCLAAAGGAVLAAPVALPATIVTVGGYMVVAGSVMTAIAQSTVEGE